MFLPENRGICYLKQVQNESKSDSKWVTCDFMHRISGVFFLDVMGWITVRHGPDVAIRPGVEKDTGKA